MAQESRILQVDPVQGLNDYMERGGGIGVECAAEMSPLEIVDTVESSGLRGRGGGGFPTGRKWRTVAEMSTTAPSTVVVNGAEGEPGSFKDRTILRNNPYQVIEGALIAARAVGARLITVAVKAEFEREIQLLERAISEFTSHGLADVSLRLLAGPSAYLFGEESALLEVVEGRAPLPRVNPPYRRGVGPGTGDMNTASDAHLAGDTGRAGPSALVNNVETFANITYLFHHGVERFRSVGTSATPGTTVCTLTGAVNRHAVGEFATTTTLREVVDTLGHGARPERTLIGAISGTANSVLPASDFDTELCFDAMDRVGSGLGASGFIVFDDHTDLDAIAYATARFLAIESCGQCEPCKVDGAAIAATLDPRSRSDSTDTAVDADVARLLSTVADGARCGLAAQHERAVASLHQLARSAHAVEQRPDRSDVDVVAPIIDIVDGTAVVDAGQLDKALDWTSDGTDSGTTPADRLSGVHRS